MKALNKKKEKASALLKLWLKKGKNFFLNNLYVIHISLPFFGMDIITRLFGSNIDFYSIEKFSPNFFTITWIILFVGLTLSYKKKIGKFIYLFVNIAFLAMFLTNNVYYSLTETFFDFSLVESASEGSPYIIDTLLNCNILVYISLLFIIFLIHFGYKKIPYKTKNNNQAIIYVILIFLVCHIIAPITLGKANSELTWSSWKNPRNIYISFNDNNKSMKICGLYEYTIRNYYITFLKTDEQENTEDNEFLDTAFADSEKHKNKYTGIFKDKNLIFIQLEGTDNWLINKNDTPTLYKMINSSYNFTNHYSYYNGGGSTFNSEFAVNTGFITPLSYTQNAYTFNKNSFPYSMANLFKKEGYSVNAFHMNTGEYYSRTTNYKNWGYDNYYGLIDIQNYKNNEHYLDRELILNDTFNQLEFPINTNDDADVSTKFVDYIITYSGHLPFSSTKGVCKQLVDLDNMPLETTTTSKPSSSSSSSSTEEKIIEMTEEECVRRQAKETDYMMELLLQNLEDKNLLDNTVIIVFTDHYLYTLEDKTILDKYKDTSNNLINKTPFFIWSNKTKKATIKAVTSQLNILPTTLNLFGIDYNVNNYIGNDALDPGYNGIVFFSDYSWYDGNVYVENGEVKNKKDISLNSLEEKNYYISYITKKNDLSLKYNYFKNNKKESN